MGFGWFCGVDGGGAEGLVWFCCGVLGGFGVVEAAAEVGVAWAVVGPERQHA